MRFVVANKRKAHISNVLLLLPSIAKYGVTVTNFAHFWVMSTVLIRPRRSNVTLPPGVLCSFYGTEGVARSWPMDEGQTKIARVYRTVDYVRTAPRILKIG